LGHFRKHCISFLVSSHCNLACEYCYIPKWGDRVAPRHRVIDLEFAVACLKEFFSWAPVPAIRFFSAGEPTNEFNRMVEIHREAKALAGDRLQVELQTNGFFNGAVADWVAENVNILWISCDGPAEIHDRQRPMVGGRRSSDVVFRNIERFSRRPDVQFGIRATYRPEDFGRQIEILDFFRGMGVKYVCGAPAYSSTVNPNVAVPMLVDFAQHFVPAFFHAQKVGMFYQTHLMVNFDEEVTCYCRAGTKPVCPQLTSDGYVSCCDWACFGPDYLPDMLQQCVYGRWDPVEKKIIYDEDRRARIESRDVERLGQGDCQDCPVLMHCAGGCIGKVMVRSGDLHEMDPNWCAAVKYLAERLPLNLKNQGQATRFRLFTPSASYRRVPLSEKSKTGSLSLVYYRGRT
jgi:radical SAM protein with 4Fe4S-binding SPASM domain